MSSFSLTDETAIDVLIFWIESSDGAVSYEEEAEVKRQMENMNYEMDTYHKTMSHLNGLSTKGIKEAEKDAIDYVKRNFTDDRRLITFNLLHSIASAHSGISAEEKKKLDELRDAWGL